MTDLKNSILHKIKEGEIQQTSRWYFVTRDYVFYVVAILTTVLGALATAALLFTMLEEHAPHVRDLPRGEYWRSFFDTMPWVWFGLFILLGILAWLNYKNTRRAYRQHNTLVVSVVLLLSVLGGAVLFELGVGRKLEEGARRHVPMYEQRAEYRENMRATLLKRHQERVGQDGLPDRPLPPHLLERAQGFDEYSE